MLRKRGREELNQPEKHRAAEAKVVKTLASAAHFGGASAVGGAGGKIGNVPAAGGRTIWKVPILLTI